MNCKIKLLMSKAVVVILSVLLQACGVKGDPLPPVTPAELGRGRPTYRGATEGMKVEHKSKRAEPIVGNEDEELEEDQEGGAL